MSLMRNGIAMFALALGGLLALSSVVVVGEGEQAVITRMGEPIAVVNRFRPSGPSGAGAVLKLPFVDQVNWVSRGLVGYSLGGQKIRSADEQTLLVDADVTYRVIDPVRMVGTLGTAERIGDQLHAILPSLLEEKLAQRPADEIAMPGSGGANRQMLSALDAKLRAYGVQVVDLRIGRITLPDAARQLTFDRMQERFDRRIYEIQEASAQEARQIMADAEARAAQIMQDSGGRDPEFYGYFRALRSYDTVFGDQARKGTTPIVLPPNSDYLKYFNGK